MDRLWATETCLWLAERPRQRIGQEPLRPSDRFLLLFFFVLERKMETLVGFDRLVLFVGIA